MKIIFTGGGTMGHISPSIAVAEALKTKNSSAEILFINRKNEQENKRIRSAGFDVKEIEISGLERKISAKNLCRRIIKTVILQCLKRERNFCDSPFKPTQKLYILSRSPYAPQGGHGLLFFYATGICG